MGRIMLLWYLLLKCSHNLTFLKANIKNEYINLLNKLCQTFSIYLINLLEKYRT